MVLAGHSEYEKEDFEDSTNDWVDEVSRLLIPEKLDASFDDGVGSNRLFNHIQLRPIAAVVPFMNLVMPPLTANLIKSIYISITASWYPIMHHK